MGGFQFRKPSLLVHYNSIWVQELRSAFIRASQKVLGEEKNVITYVEDIVLQSPGLEDKAFVY